MLRISLLFLCLVASSAAPGATGIATENGYGIYELKTGDFRLKVTNYGARMVSLIVPDKHGKPVDVILGYDSVKEYLNDSSYFGAIVGRVANRIGGAQFTLNGKTYKLDANEKNNMLHGGKRGFGKVAWKVVEYVKDGPNPFIVFTYFSPDGEEGFPGNLYTTVTYALQPGHKLTVTMVAEALNKPTPVNLAQHSYWNLGGHTNGDVLSDEVQIFGSHITPTDANLIPTGQVAPVKGTPYDFLQRHKVGKYIKVLAATKGYDINYALDKGKDVAVKVYSKKTGIGMKIFTDAPGVQFYTANYVQNVTGKGGFVYQQHSAYCFESQGFPDAVNHPNFPSTIVKPGHVYTHNMLFEFKIYKE